MKKYNVRLYFHTSVEVEVEAMDRQQAIEYAREKASSQSSNKELLDNLQEDDRDVYVWNDQVKDYQAT